MLARAREPLLRRFLGLVVERSSMEELAVRPLGERMLDFELLLEAAERETRTLGAARGRTDRPDAATVTRLYPR